MAAETDRDYRGSRRRNHGDLPGRKPFRSRTQSGRLPLTAADRAAHAVISAGLQELTPTIPQLSEEGQLAGFEERRQWERYWLIDPLDGTKEFIKRNDEFTVNIALIENHKPVLGVVHAPALGTTYVGSPTGAQRKRDGVTETIRTRPLGSPLTAVVSRSHRGERVDTLLERLPETTTTSVGSSLKFCLVAEGEADLYPRFGPTSEWDTGAAHCVVEAAGGLVCKADLSPLRYNAKESILNPDFLVIGDPNHDWASHLTGIEGEER
ncbi:3'(2'),5'-bisphosphate nucleotidase CysQ [Alkalilimnicola ehrlichii]|uniref:3'(2'),5'-bisphosphate nucleotidase CysQ n=1 Tax=Alkalilimnicola ehrlichii TaxID=351052 RepID=UPI00384DC6F8